MNDLSGQEPKNLPSDDEILSEYAPEQGAGSKSALYDRTMTYRLRKSLVTLGEKLTGLMETIHRASQLQRDQQDKVADAEARAKRSANRLSIVIVISTISYVVITAFSVRAQYQSNAIQQKSDCVATNNETNSQKSQSKKTNQ